MSNPTPTPPVATSDELGIPATADLPAASPARLAREAAALNAVVAAMNKEAGVQPDPEAQVVTSVKYSPAPVAKPAQQVTHPRSPFNTKLLMFSGSLKAGKDHVAAAAGATTLGLADPLYRIREVFFGKVQKDQFGARSFLQTIGQWGRGTVDDKYPLSPARAAFSQMVRDMGGAGAFGFSDVSWKSFGFDENLWLDALLKRIEKYTQQPGNEDARIAVTNIRFKNEVDALTAVGFTHWHVMCGPETWNARLKAAGLDPKSPALDDLSEKMAQNLSAQAMQASRRAPTRKLRAIWNDERQPAPSQAFFSLDEFLKELSLFS